jgi:hypothetical protein
MVMAFVLGGVGLFAAGVRELIRRFAARHRLRSANGEIVRIEKRQETTTRTAAGRLCTTSRRSSSAPSGAANRASSQTSAGERTARYAVGQTIDVLYDPNGELSPMINSWAGQWVSPLIQVIVGPMFIFAGLFVSWAFGDKILGQ